ncbi:MAG: hypothetical protein MUQ65_04995 [Armatimonadetes bacterium]|nr:hypothetical protein [Armatimonadota bacterium]
MKRAIWLVALLSLLAGLPALAFEREGSLPTDLAALNPPQPNDISVAVLPFWSRDEAQRELGRACILLNLMRQGFRLAPTGSETVPALVRKTDQALRNDSQWDPLATTEPEDAARIGKALGATWVVYGEVGELQVKSEKRGLLPKKAGVIDLRLHFIEVATGKTLYWSRITDTASCGGWSSSAGAIERRLLTRTINTIFDDLATALPDHYTGAEVTPEEVQRLYETIAQ